MACVYLHNFILDKESGNTDIPLFRDIELNFSTATQKRAANAALLYLKYNRDVFIKDYKN